MTQPSDGSQLPDPFAPPPAGGTNPPTDPTAIPPVPPMPPFAAAPPAGSPVPPYGSAPGGAPAQGTPVPPYGSPYGSTPTSPYGAPVQPPNDTPGLVALLAGIGSWLLCPIVLSIVAIIFGRQGMRLAAAGQANNGTFAKVGYWLGIISLVVSILAIIFWIFVVILAVASGSTTSLSTS